MSSVPLGYGTIGPFVENLEVKDKFIEVCKAEGKTMENKLKELVLAAIQSRFPGFLHPDKREENVV